MYRKEVETIFGSASCLNASFLDKKFHFNTSNRYPGVDIAKVKSISKILLNLNDTFLNELVRRMTNKYAFIQFYLIQHDFFCLDCEKADTTFRKLARKSAQHRSPQTLCDNAFLGRNRKTSAK